MISRDGNFRAFDSDVIQKFECFGIKMLSWIMVFSLVIQAKVKS